MSFSREVKEELTRQKSKSRHCQLAELAAILALEGKELIPDVGDISLRTDNPLLQQKYAMLMEQAFSADVEKTAEPEEVQRILMALKQLPCKEDVNGLLVQKTCCKRAFIRGAFLAAGSISNPNKSYHFEIVCRSDRLARQIRELMADFEADAKIVERKQHYVVYLKEGSQIVDMLNVMEAYVSLMNLENVRIIKEMRNSVNRKVNCETANISKTVNAAVKQIADITRIRDVLGFEKLPPHLRQMAQLRLEHPDAPLKELGEYLEPPVGKSGVNHRLRKLSAIAEKLPDKI